MRASNSDQAKDGDSWASDLVQSKDAYIGVKDSVYAEDSYIGQVIQSNLEMFILGQDCPLGKLEVGASHHAFPSLVKLEGDLICHCAALYEANIWRHLAEATALVKSLVGGLR